MTRIVNRLGQQLRAGTPNLHYAVFRVVIGTYFFVQYARVLPWATEMFSSQGMVAPEANPYYSYLPAALFGWSAETAFVLVLASSVLGLLLAVGVWDRLAAGLLWLLHATLFTQNPLMLNPSTHYLGWLLVAHAVLSPTLVAELRGRDWYRPLSLYTAAWVVMSIAYSYSGFTKLVSPSWADGTAVMHVLQHPAARPGIRELALALPEPFLYGLSYFFLGLELFFAPLCVFRRLRPWVWAAMTGVMLGLLTVMSFIDIPLGMLIMHLYTFDPEWLGRWSPAWLRSPSATGALTSSPRLSTST